MSIDQPKINLNIEPYKAIGPARLPSGGEPVAYSTTAIDLDGVSDRYRSASLTSQVNSKKGILSFWFRLDGRDGANRRIYVSQTAYVDIAIRSTDLLTIQIYSVIDGLLVNLSTVSTFTASASWRHLLASWDTSIGAGAIYVDDALDSSGSVSMDATNDLKYIDPSAYLGANVDGSGDFQGCWADYYFNQSDYLDFSVVANRRLFRDASGKPVSLGPTGNLPTTNQPIIFLKGDATDFHDNLGFGGALTVDGAPTDCSSSPTD